MGLRWALFTLLAGCPGGPTDGLALDGPAAVRVDSLGPVTTPAVLLPEGVAAQDISWTVTPESVAVVESGEVVAVGAGEATVTGTWSGQTVSWTLEVDPAVTLQFIDTPGALSVGDQASLTVKVTLDGETVTGDSLEWSSNAPQILTVDGGGQVSAVAAGTAYVTVSRGSSEAMVELIVR